MLTTTIAALLKNPSTGNNPLFKDLGITDMLRLSEKLYQLADTAKLQARLQAMDSSFPSSDGDLIWELIHAEPAVEGKCRHKMRPWHSRAEEKMSMRNIKAALHKHNKTYRTYIWFDKLV